jgi:hypothetical protein
MWRFQQSTGRLWHLAPSARRLVATGYAGSGPGVNNPDMQNVPQVGPCPQGRYSIGPPEDGHGGYTLRLRPLPGTVMFGRSGFLIHGDDFDPAPNSASKGCLIFPRAIREAIWRSGDRVLEVIR